MGIPVVEAMSEAEAQCAALVKDNIAWATASEDADSLAFGTNILLRHMSYADQKKKTNYSDKSAKGFGNVAA